MNGEAGTAKALEAIADELAGIRETLESLDRLLSRAIVAPPAGQRLHQALGVCWCRQAHSIAEAIALNAAIDIIQVEGDTDGSR